MKAFKTLTLMMLMALAVGSVHSQVLVKTCTFNESEAAEYRQSAGIEFVNKPNGTIYRLREEVPYPNLPRTEEVEDLLLIITDRTETGFVALFRNPLGANEYKFIVLTYNDKRKITGSYDLCQLSETWDCEVQDIRWFDNHLYFNMACPTYSSSQGGRGSKLFSLNLANEQIEWSTQYLTSNDVFVVDQYFVYTEYGFTDEPDFVFLIDRATGRTLTKCPIWTKGEYMELVGPQRLYVQDYNDWGYVFDVAEKGIRVTGTGVRLRVGPTTSSAYLVDSEGRTVTPLNGDILPTWGEEGDFYKVQYDGANMVYISRLYSTTEIMPNYDSCDAQWAGVRTWQGADDDVVHFEIYDMEKFCNAVNIAQEDCSLSTGVYNVTIDSPLSCGVYINQCYNSLGLYVMSEDCRAFGLDLSGAARGEDLSTVEFPHSMLGEDFCVSGFETKMVEDYEGISRRAVYAISQDGLYSEQSLDFSDVEGDFDYYYEGDEPGYLPAPDMHYNMKGSLEDGDGNTTQVEVSLETIYSGLAAGTITYHRKKGKASTISLYGTVRPDWEWEADDIDDMHFVAIVTEYLNDGKQCGTMMLTLSRSDIMDGVWLMDDKVMTLNIDEQNSAELSDEPDFLQPLGLKDAEGTWCWKTKADDHPVLKEFAGTFEGHALSDDSLQFSACTVMPNIAEASGVFTAAGPDSFLWTNEDCGNTYRIQVFKNAIHVGLLFEEDDTTCYGAGATLEGWYIRSDKKKK